MGSYGREELTQTVGRSIQVAVDQDAEMKEAGVTIDWTTVQALGAPATYLDGVKVATGEKVLRYGQVLGRITATGKYGPFDSTAGDGREIVENGRIYIVNETRKQTDKNSDHPPVLHGGRVWEPRIIFGGGGGQITRAQLLSACPRLRFVTGA